MIALLSAPTNLGLRPPQVSSVPGCAKAPEAYRQAGLYDRLIARGAVDAGVVLPGRYVDDADPAAHRVRNQDAIIDHSERLAARIDRLLDDGHAPLVLGGDCSLLIGAGLALSRRGRHGLVHLDGHTDFRHPGNNPSCASLAGEDLAAAVGIHWPAVANIDERGPYFDPADVVAYWLPRQRRRPHRAPANHRRRLPRVRGAPARAALRCRRGSRRDRLDANSRLLASPRRRRARSSTDARRRQPRPGRTRRRGSGRPAHATRPTCARRSRDHLRPRPRPRRPLRPTPR